MNRAERLICRSSVVKRPAGQYIENTLHTQSRIKCFSQNETKMNAAWRRTDLWKLLWKQEKVELTSDHQERVLSRPKKWFSSQFILIKVEMLS